MPTTRFKGETAGERLDKSSISDSDMLQLRHKPGTIEDADKGISKAQLLSCPFGVSDTAAATAAKAASLTDSNPDFTLVSGREVVVCFTAANTASNPTLNFAGSGAIPLYRTNGEAVSNWPADTWMHLKYFFATVGNTTIQRWILLSPLPVDEVAANNMNSVTSNAVYDVASKVESQNFTNSYKVGVFVFRRTGKIVTMQTGGGDWNNLPVAQYIDLFNIPEKFRPSIDVALFEQTGAKITIQILVGGLVRVYNYESQVSTFNGYYNGCWLAAN